MEFRSGNQRPHRIGRPPPALCRKHPKHHQSPGVCSICLNERLSQLSSSSSRANTTRADSSSSSSSLSSLSSSSHYSASASSSSSPVHPRHYRIISDRKGFSATFFRSRKCLLTQSRSVAFITRRKEAAAASDMDEIEDHRHEKKKAGFWSKFLRPRNTKIDAALAHSRTTNERMATTQVH